MASPIVLAVDAMSGDHGHSVTVPAALSCLERHKRLHLVLVGDQVRLRAALLDTRWQVGRRLSIRHASEVVAMDESPARTLKNKKDSSMRVAIDLVKSGQAHAAVSAGNTGALMATARFVLKTLPGIDRPAIVSALPAVLHPVHMLDLGANAECTAEQLVQFAVMGSALVTAVHGVVRPRVALLNIGSEAIKGNDTIKAAAALLQASSLNYVGFVEGDGVFLSDVDVVVCDGFVGNVALKTGEGIAKLIRQFMREEFERNVLTRAGAMAAMPALKSLSQRIDPRRYNGASFVGLQGIVIKSHGGADAVAFENALDVALREVDKNVPTRISKLLASAGLPPARPGAAQAAT